MPPKPKPKKRATQKQKQSQSQVVNIRIGETKAKRKSTRKPKGKSVVKDNLPDGWLPPVNLTRSGQVFEPYTPSVSSAPPVITFPPEMLQRLLRLEQGGSAGGFAPPRPPEPSLLTMGEPEPIEPPEPPTPSFVAETPAPKPPPRALPPSPLPSPPPKMNLIGELKQKLVERERKKLEAPPPESFVVPPAPEPEVFAPIEDKLQLEKMEKVKEPEPFTTPTKKQSKDDVYKEIGVLFQELGIGQKTNEGKALIKSIVGVFYKANLKDNDKGLLVKLRNGLRDKLAMESTF